MSRIKSDKISLADSIVVDFFSNESKIEQEPQKEEISSEDLSRLNLLLLEAQEKAQKIIDEANLKSQEIIDKARYESDELISSAQLEVQKLTNDSQELLSNAKLEADNLIKAANDEAEQIKVNASQDGAKEGYQAGYEDGLNKIKEELLQKIYSMDEVVKTTFDMKNKILTSSKKEIIELVLAIARKISINSVDEQCVAKVVSNSISLLSDKENIELILSEKYAKLLNQVLNDDLLGQKAESGIDIDKLRSIKLVYNSKLHDDTLIVQTPKERLDLSFQSQLDEISKEFLKELNSSFDIKDEENNGEI